MEIKFIVSECGNSPDDAWGRAVAKAEYENYTKHYPHRGILSKKGFKLIGNAQDRANVLQVAQVICDNHKESHPYANNALCINAGAGEYYFIGKSFTD